MYIMEEYTYPCIFHVYYGRAIGRYVRMYGRRFVWGRHNSMCTNEQATVSFHFISLKKIISSLL